MRAVGIALRRKERGDTLIEVTIALSILATVISSGYVMANRAYNIGQAARERSQVINLAQAQIEQLKNFRDTHTWDYFLNDSSYGLKTVMAGSTCPSGISQCFHMIPATIAGVTQYVPAKDSQTLPGTGGTIAFTGTPGSPDPDVADLQVKFDFPLRGGGDAVNNTSVKLVNIEGIIQ